MWHKIAKRIIKKPSRSTPGEILNTSLMYLTMRFFSLTILSIRTSLGGVNLVSGILPSNFDESIELRDSSESSKRVITARVEDEANWNDRDKVNEEPSSKISFSNLLVEQLYH